MSNITDTGFLLRKFPYSESSLVLKAFTREHGVVSFMAKGARRQNSRLHGLLEPGLHLQFLFPAHGRGEMRILSDVALLRDFPGVRDDIVRQGLAQVFGEVLLKYLPDGARAPDFHDLMLRSLERIDVTESTGSDRGALQERLAAFLLDFCKLSGFQPQFRLCAQCGGRISGAIVDFSVEQGGPVCGKCRSGEEGSVRMRESTLLWLRAVQDGVEDGAQDAAEAKDPSPEMSRSDMGRAVDFLLLYLGRHAGGQKPLKSLEVWRGLLG
ncbi:MAG TPA: DNA repair protein RecO [Fibrobacteria bacterium]|jgi:DNA repair protein RecO (recombination protein O)|nr:DNA repair protein RecO [Fibrobacteria bacterium]